MNKGTRNALLGFIAGAAAGTLAGILIAPEKGAETRKKISWPSLPLKAGD